MSDKQVNIMEGHTQVGTNNTQKNTTNNNTTNSGVNIHFHQNNNFYHGNAPEPVAQHSTTSQILSREQLLQLQQVCQTGLEHAAQQIADVMARQQPTEQQSTSGQSVPPPSQSVGESPQTCPPESPQSRCPLSDHHQPSRKSGRDTDRKQESSRKNKETDRQPPNQTPGCSEYDQTSRVPAEETVPTKQPASTETAECVRLVDCKGRQLQPGDGVCVKPDECFSSRYWGVYVGGRELICCDPKTQEVKMEMMDISNTIYRLTPVSGGPCKIFPAETRLDRARSCIGKVPPLKETTWCGLDFVYWTFTGLNMYQARMKGFRVSR